MSGKKSRKNRLGWHQWEDHRVAGPERGQKGGEVKFDRAAEARLSVAVRKILRQEDATAE